MPRLATKGGRKRSERSRGGETRSGKEEKGKNNHKLKRDVQLWEGEPDQGWRKEKELYCKPDSMPRLAAGEVVGNKWDGKWNLMDGQEVRGLAEGANTGGGAIPLPWDLPLSGPLAEPLEETAEEFFKKLLGGSGFRGGQSEEIYLFLLVAAWIDPQQTPFSQLSSGGCKGRCGSECVRHRKKKTQ